MDWLNNNKLTLNVKTKNKNKNKQKKQKQKQKTKTKKNKKKTEVMLFGGEITLSRNNDILDVEIKNSCVEQANILNTLVFI